MAGKKSWFQKAAGVEGGTIRGINASGQLAKDLTAQYGLYAGAQGYNILGKKTDIIGDGVTPFRTSLREVRTVNQPYQVGQRSNDTLLTANKTSLLKTAGLANPDNGGGNGY